MNAAGIDQQLLDRLRRAGTGSAEHRYLQATLADIGVWHLDTAIESGGLPRPVRRVGLEDHAVHQRMIFTVVETALRVFSEVILLNDQAYSGQDLRDVFCVLCEQVFLYTYIK